MTATEQPINIKASAWTIGVHIVLLLLLIFIKYSVPVVTQPTPEMGMEVNLGTDENGSGNDQPMLVDEPAPAKTSVSYKLASHENNEPKDILKTEEPDAPAVAPVATVSKTPKHIIEKQTHKTTPKKVELPAENTAKANTVPQRPRYVYNGSTGKGGNSATTNMPGKSEGNTFGNGDRGVPSGTPGAANYTGTPGKGTGGISHTLSGRSIVAFPSPDADFREGGRVVIRVTVSKAGVIVNKQIVSASNAELRTIALRKVEKIRFNKSDDAPEEQFGNITFVFKTRS
jgi:outer membrane biosynthesis protein TonB